MERTILILFLVATTFATCYGTPTVTGNPRTRVTIKQPNFLSDRPECEFACGGSRKRKYCGSDGTTFRNSCQVKKAKCYDPLLKVKRGKCKAKDVCSQARTHAILSPYARYLPLCTSDGRYAPHQCYDTPPYCVCLDPEGKMIPGSAHRHDQSDCPPIEGRRLSGRSADSCTEEHLFVLIQNIENDVLRELRTLQTSRSSRVQRLRNALTVTFNKADQNANNEIDLKELRKYLEVKHAAQCVSTFAHRCDGDLNNSVITLSEWNRFLFNLSLVPATQTTVSIVPQTVRPTAGRPPISILDESVVPLVGKCYLNNHANTCSVPFQPPVTYEACCNGLGLGWGERCMSCEAVYSRRKNIFKDLGGQCRGSAAKGVESLVIYDIMSEYALVSPLQPTLPAMDRINSSLLWKFAQLDVNGDDVITSRELRAFRRRLRSVLSKYCFKFFAIRCDKDRNQRMTSAEWLECLTPVLPTVSTVATSRITPTSEAGPSARTCISEREKSLLLQSSGTNVYVPQCEGNLFNPVQCHASAGYCWCVTTDTGHPIIGTTAGSDSNLNCSRHSTIAPPNRNTSPPVIKGCKKTFVPSALETISTRLRGSPGSGENYVTATSWFFELLDKNHDGMLNKRESRGMKKKLKGKIGPMRCVRRLVKSCDANKNKKIDETEFFACLGVSRARTVHPIDRLPLFGGLA